MKKYSVSITRIGYAHTTFEVEAENEADAQEKAMDQAGDYDFSEGDADYECEGVTCLDVPEEQTQAHILITAEMEIGDGTGYDGMTLFDVPVDADITEKDFLCELKKMMDVPWQQDGDFRYIAITDEKLNKTRLCHLLATLEY